MDLNTSYTVSHINTQSINFKLLTENATPKVAKKLYFEIKNTFNERMIFFTEVHLVNYVMPASVLLAVKILSA